MTKDHEPNPWAEIIGPCYTTASMARALESTEEEVTVVGEPLNLLALETDDGVTLYPSFQLNDGHVVEGLADVLRVFKSGVDSPWTWAQWLNRTPTLFAPGMACRRCVIADMAVRPREPPLHSRCRLLRP